MKKLFILLIVAFVAFAASAQNLKKGNLVGIHVATLKLNPNFTADQVTDFFIKKYIPAFEKNYPGTKCYSLKGIRGEHANSFGMIVVFESEAARDKYYNKDGSRSELGKAAEEKMKPIIDMLASMGTETTVYTDWVIQ